MDRDRSSGCFVMSIVCCRDLGHKQEGTATTTITTTQEATDVGGSVARQLRGVWVSKAVLSCSLLAVVVVDVVGVVGIGTPTGDDDGDVCSNDDDDYDGDTTMAPVRR